MQQTNIWAKEICSQIQNTELKIFQNFEGIIRAFFQYNNILDKSKKLFLAAKSKMFHKPIKIRYFNLKGNI